MLFIFKNFKSPKTSRHSRFLKIRIQLKAIPNFLHTRSDYLPHDLSSFSLSRYEGMEKFCWNVENYLWRNRLTSMIFLLVRDSWGSLYSVYLRRTLSMSVLAYWYNLLLELKIIRAISQSHSTDSSYAFFITPNFLLLKVTCFEKPNSKSFTRIEKNSLITGDQIDTKIMLINEKRFFASVYFDNDIKQLTCSLYIV